MIGGRALTGQAGQGSAFFVLTRWHTDLAPGRTPAGPQARAQGVRLASLRSGCRFVDATLSAAQAHVSIIWQANASASNSTVLRGSLS